MIITFKRLQNWWSRYDDPVGGRTGGLPVRLPPGASVAARQHIQLRQHIGLSHARPKHVRKIQQILAT